MTEAYNPLEKQIEWLKDVEEDCEPYKDDIVACPTNKYYELKKRLNFGVIEPVVPNVHIRRIDYHPNRRLCIKKVAVASVPTPKFEDFPWALKLYREARWLTIRNDKGWRLIAIDYIYAPRDPYGIFFLKYDGGKWSQIIELNVEGNAVKLTADVDVFLHYDFGGYYNIVFALTWFSRIRPSETRRAYFCYYWCYPKEFGPQLDRDKCLTLYESLMNE